MPRPSRLGLALAATVAASSLFVGGGLAAAAPSIPCTDAAKTIPANCDPNESAGTTGNGSTGGSTTGGDTGGTTSGTTGGATTGGTTNGGTTGGATSGGSAGSGGQSNGGGYQKPSSYKPWKGDRGNPRKDRNDPPRRQGDEKDCRDFDNRDEAQDWYRSHGKPGDKDPSRLDRDKDGRVCENDDDDGDDSDPVIPPKVDVTVIINQTEDDGSEATTSGEQVKQVPEGSVDTGSAQ